MAETAFQKHFRKGKVKKSPMTRRPSDEDSGYLWGKAGRAKARKLRTKSGYLWAGYQPKD